MSRQFQTFLDRLSETVLDPLPDLLLHRDVLGITGKGLREVTERARTSTHYVRLAEAQYPDGSWGRFHTENTKQKQPVPTTEIGLRRALESGLPAEDPILRKVVAYIERVLRDGLDWRDWHEKHDNPAAWPWHVRHISAANLALIDPTHPLLNEHRAFWRSLAGAAFASGSYDPDAEAAAYNDAVTDEYRQKRPPVCWRRYALILLSTDSAKLKPGLEGLLAEKFVVDMNALPSEETIAECVQDPLAGRRIYDWLSGSQPAWGLPTWRAMAAPVFERLIDVSDEGTWDLGTRLPKSPFSCFPLSESHRRRGIRALDHSIWLWGRIQRLYSTRN